MDANVFIILHRNYPQSLIPDLWDLLDELVAEEKLISHQLIFDELVPDSGEPTDEVGRWAEKNKSCFWPVSQEQANLIGSVLAAFPKLIKHDNPRNQADPLACRNGLGAFAKSTID